ncbi:MAG: Nif3-like dinuclear metal center hexameric protein [Candidatus Pacearchaeota archaeon]
MHVPLDNFGEYSKSVCLAEALKIKIEKPCSPYYGSLAGVIGKTKCRDVFELIKIFEKAVGHRVSLYNYGKKEISDGKVAVLAGGGNYLDYLKDVFEEGVKTIITGISAKNSFSEKTHNYEEKQGINVLGGTHYSTEKFACQKICNYFQKIGLPSEFIEEEPLMEDL